MRTLFKSFLPWLLSLVRIAIGWHFLYEGVTKIVTEGWSSASYLAGSKWNFAPLFQTMAENSGIIALVDFLNMGGMILVGLGLISGLFTRFAAGGGALMLFFYFVAYPPIPGYIFGVPAEGSYLWVNRNLIGGWAHARDLIYVSKLVKTYHTDEKVMQTLALNALGQTKIRQRPWMG